MRLIDADKVDMPIMQRKDNEWVFRYNIKEALDTLPTVKAIPISELRRWLNKQDMPYKDYVIGVVEYAINAWEKENETGNSNRTD